MAGEPGRGGVALFTSERRVCVGGEGVWTRSEGLIDWPSAKIQ